MPARTSSSSRAVTPSPCSPGLSLTVHRLVQESLTNARRHGTQGKTSVLLSWSSDCLTVLVNSPLPHPALRRSNGHGHGITGMQERTSAYGGLLEVGPEGETWRVEAQLPLQRGPA